MADDERSIEGTQDEERATRPVYMISVAAELAGVHPQTLRIYERRELIHPVRTAGGTRRYSDRDIARIRVIQELTQEFGLNLAGVERVMELQTEVEELHDALRLMQRRAREMHEEMLEAVRQAHREHRAEIVPLRTQPPARRR